MERQYYVYILSNNTHTTIYTGVTNDLYRRMDEHRNDTFPDSFTARYKVHRLVYYEATNDIRDAIQREKQIKGWNRRRKNELVKSMNPEWKDLYPMLLEG